MPFRATTELETIALRKMSAVLGEPQAKRLLAQALANCRLDGIRTPAELMLVAECLGKQHGFVATLGAMLGVAAVLRGATPHVQAS